MSEIILLFGGVGSGKSSLLANFALSAFDNSIFDIANLNEELVEFKKIGYVVDNDLEHLVFSNLKMQNELYSSHDFSPKKFAISATDKSDFIPFYSHLYIDEAQRYFNSRKKTLSDEQSRAFELCRHADINITLACQRPMLIDLNIRDLVAKFFHIIDKKDIYDSFNRVKKTIWTTCMLTSNADLEEYLKLPDKQKRKVSKTVIFEYEGCIYDYYNSKFFRNLFIHPSKNKFDVLDNKAQITSLSELTAFKLLHNIEKE